MAYESMDDFINKVTVLGQIDDLSWYKFGVAAEAAGVWQSLWNTPGLPGQPTSGLHATNPGTAFTSAVGGFVEGAIYYANRSPSTKNLLTFGASPTLDVTLALYDRLYGCGHTQTTGAVNINPTASVALPRYATGLGVEAWIEIVATNGSPSITAVSYTNENGTAGRTGTCTLAATPVNQSMYQVRLQAGDLGVRSVQTITYSGVTTSTANLVLLKPLVYLPAAGQHWVEVDMINRLHALPQVFDGATLSMMYLPTTTTAINFHGQIRLGWG